MRGPVFENARTREGFAEVEADAETGTVVWPGGSDLAPDTLYERVRTGVCRSLTPPPEPESGGGGIRTHERLATPTVFETVTETANACVFWLIQIR